MPRGQPIAIVISLGDILDWFVIASAWPERSAQGSPPPDKPEDGKDTDARDVRLLRGIADGDQEAFRQLYQRHNSLLFSLALRVLNDRDDAEDVLQEVFLQVWKSAGSFNPTRSKPIVWLIMVTRSRSIDRLRSRQTRQRATEEAAAESTSNHPSPTQEAAANETQGIVRRAVESLPADQRTLLELAYFGGLSQSEIAERVAQPLGTVKTRMRAGMTRLREQLITIVGEGGVP